MSNLYKYVGSKNLLNLLTDPSDRCRIVNGQSVLHWINSTKQKLDKTKSVVATFILDQNKQVWIADQHSEHVVCARGEPVLTAGEITFTVTNHQVEISAISNQSTGYCPEPESWETLANVLSQIQIYHPANWTTEFIFRRCIQCDTINVVKDGWFGCAVCNGPLSRAWNLMRKGEVFR